MCVMLANGTPCDDGNLCTQVDTCQNGTCVGGNPVICSASDQCHEAGTCDPDTGLCSNPPKADGAPCDDGNPCTQTDTCQSGACVGGNPVVCTASDQCHVAGVCDPTTGTCSNPAKPNGAPCDDGNVCTSGDTCQGGVCTSGTAVAGCCNTAADCPTPANQCKQAACVSNACVEQNKANGTGCNDGDACVGDTCLNGVCQSVCTGGNICCGPTTMFPGSCKFATGHACTGNGNCCSGNCVGPMGSKTCA
jgi:hypothetical protein